MKRILVAALAAAVATLSFIPDADARNGGQRWMHHGGGHHGWRNGGGHHGGYHHGYRHHGYNHGHGHHHGGYYGGYYGGGYYGGGWGWGFGFPGIVIAPGYYDGYAGNYGDCYIRRVRHHDRNGHVYVRRVEVCN